MALKDRLALAGAVVGLGLAAREFLKWRNTLDLEGQVVLITGSSRGLGFALAREFGHKGAHLVICARNEQELERARQKLAQQGADVLAIPCDVTQPDQIRKLVAQATAHYGRVDILVNTAGIITVGPLLSQTLQDFEESMNVMFWAIYHTTMAVLPQMLERKSGHIVNITSIGGKVSVPHLLPYDTAKFAAVGFSEGLRAELAKEGIKVTTVAPGLMRTGSPVHAYFKGKNQQEYTWFSVFGSLPISSINATRAARQIIRATQRGDAELIITFQAQLLARFHGLFPGITTNILGFVNRFLPGASPTEGMDRHTGEESETPITRSFLTALNQRATREYNQY